MTQNTAQRTQVIDLYHEVFYPTGDVKLCGRDKCRALMLACAELADGERFGNINTGRMDVPKIKEFVEGLLAEEKLGM